MFGARGLLSIGLVISAAIAVSAHGPHWRQGSCDQGACSLDSILLQRAAAVSTALLGEERGDPDVVDAPAVLSNSADLTTTDAVHDDSGARRFQKHVVKIPCTIRDFNHEHPDFYLPEEGPPGRSFGHLKGCVQKQLGPDRKPVFDENGTCFNSSASFAQWYQDVPGVNIRDDFTMEFVPTAEGYTYGNHDFFPLDGKAWGNGAFAHNYWFTMEIHLNFTYKPGSRFVFKGDDDVWVFVNGSLVMDLGGIHTPLEGLYSVDDLNLVPGEMATLDFFFAERQPVLSTFKIEMQLALEDDLEESVGNGSSPMVDDLKNLTNLTDREFPDRIVKVPCTIRDFSSKHPDFYLPEEGPPGRSFGHLQGCVQKQLGPDRKPVFDENGTCFNSSASFAQWYQDVPGVNIPGNFTMEFVPTAEGYTYDNPAFFPFDGKAWGNETFAHNYWFTMEFHGNFIYEEGSRFVFKGDDDVWVFINGTLAMDLGGIHTPLESELSLEHLNLVPGEMATLDFFFAERQPFLSTFKIDMRLRLTDVLEQLPPEGTCMIWGDPHVNVFDSVDPDGDAIGASVVNLYGHGDYWIVNSQDISIQGRYSATQWSTNGQSATKAIAIGGKFLQGHTLIIEALDGQMTWDGGAIMQNFPSSFVAEDIASARYHELEEPIDSVQTHRPIHGVDLDLPLGVRVRVNRWAQHLDVLITMRPQLGGQDGHCGNFNLNSTDDTLESISGRMNLRVPEQDLLFSAPSLDTADVVERSISECAPEVREVAEAECEQREVRSDGGAAPGSFIEACVYDMCFGGKDFAVQ